MAAIAEAQECVTCGAPLRGPHCHLCGERVISPDEVRVAVFLRRLAAGAFDADSRLWRSFHRLLFRPGSLTADHIRGRRKPYLKPIQIFLIANLLFFTVLSTLGGFSTFTTRLRYHTTQAGYGPMAERMVARRAVPGTPEYARFARHFDETTPRYANSMVVVMVPIYGAVLWLLYAGRHYYAHLLTFAIHFHAFLLIALVALSLLVRGFAAIAPALIARADSELFLTVVLLGTFLLYLTQAFRRAFGDRLLPALVRGALAAVLLMPVILVYRMLLFFAVYFTLDLPAQ